LSWPDSRLLESLVNGNTGAEDGSNGLEVALLRNSSDMSCLCDAILLECAIDGIARQKRLGAERFVCLLAEVALQARAIDPLHTSVIADLNVLDQVPYSDNNAGTFVAADEWKFRG
jgi:hypothetical protein